MRLFLTISLISLSMVIPGHLLASGNCLGENPYMNVSLQTDGSKGEANTESTSKWRQTGRHCFFTEWRSENLEWDREAHDTIFYNNDGDIVMKKTIEISKRNGDSTIIIDSSVYSDGNLCENISTKNKPFVWKFRNTYNQCDGGKVQERYRYTWNNDINDWIPLDKNIFYYNEPVKRKTNDDFENFGKFIKYEQFGVNTTDKSWKFACSLSVVASECNDTAIVTLKRLSAATVNDYHDRERRIYTFKKNDVSYEKRLTETLQFFNSTTGKYSNYSHSEFSGRNSKVFFWDTSGSAIVQTYLNIHFEDRYGNDTLWLTGMLYNMDLYRCDTSHVARYKRTYDVNGNNIETVCYERNPTDYQMFIKYRELNSYDQYFTSVDRKSDYRKVSDIKVCRSLHGITFSTSGITGINCFTLSGKLVYSKKQSSATSTFELRFSDMNAGAGLYFASLLCGKNWVSFPVFIR